MGVVLSPRHGVNPAIPKCFFCQEDKNQIILAGRLPGDAEAPHGAVWNKEPCDTCKGYMAQGIILISVDGKASKDPQNPWRTGGWCVVREDYIKRLPLEPEGVRDDILRKRVAFVPDDVWDGLGLPRGPVEGVPSE